jgi:pimeloyl-ACP methyl ester carboxylesterase
MMRDPLIMVPGLGCTRDLFGPQIELLSATRPTIVADHAQDDTIPAIGTRLLADAPERFALMGLSFGGYIAFEVLRQAPDRVARLALLDTSARPDTEESRATRHRLIALAQSGRFDEIHPVLWQRLVPPDRQSDRALEARVRGMMKVTGPEAFIRQQRAILARPDSRPDLSSIEIPTLVLVGAEDVITPPEVAREMAEAIEWASLVVIPETGHLSTLESPERVNRALEMWLEREQTDE